MLNVRIPTGDMFASKARRNIRNFQQQLKSMDLTVETQVEQKIMNELRGVNNLLNLEKYTQNVQVASLIYYYKTNLFQKIHKKSLKGKSLIQDCRFLSDMTREACLSVEKSVREYFEELGYTVLECSCVHGSLLVQKTANVKESNETDKTQEKRFEDAFEECRTSIQLDLCLSW